MNESQIDSKIISELETSYQEKDKEIQMLKNIIHKAFIVADGLTYFKEGSSNEIKYRNELERIKLIYQEFYEESGYEK